MTNWRTRPEDLLSPERFFFRMIKDYSRGRLNSQGRVFYRAVVVDVDPIGGQLESSPPNPEGSIRARIYTRGLDATTPSVALGIFHPFWPAHIAPPVERDEHVIVVFEDEAMSNGWWLTTVPTHRDINFRDPEENRRNTQTSANVFEGTSPDQQRTNRDAEFGGLSEESAVRDEIVQVFASDVTSFVQGKSILHIGDSQVAGPYGRELGTILLERGATSYVRDGRINWGVQSWNDGYLARGSRSQPTINELGSQHNPDVILLTLGGNDHQRASTPNYIDEVRQLYNDAWNSAGTVIWIGPPTAIGRSRRLQPGRDRVSEIIHNVVGSNFIDSREFTRSTAGRSRDGIHFGPRAARRWAEAVAIRLERF